MRAGWCVGLAACLASTACVPEPGNYYGGVQPAYGSYAQPSYAPPSYAEPGYLAPGPSYVPPYSYPVPVAPGYGYGYEPRREFRDPGFRDREFRREFQDRGGRERRFRDDQGPFRGRSEGRVERPRPPEPPRQQPGPPPGQTPPLPGGIFPGVPRPLPR